MISSNDFRTGVSIEMDGDAYVVVEFQHVKPGKGSAFVRTKLKNVRTGGVLEKNFNAGEKMPKAHLTRKAMQYLYNDGEGYVFTKVRFQAAIAHQDSENMKYVFLPLFQNIAKEGITLC